MNYLYLLLLTFLVLYSFTTKYYTRKNSGTGIVLHGPSGSGKSSLQKSFQRIMMPNLWIKTGIDSLFDMPMPDITPENMEYWQSKNPIRWVTTSKDKGGHQVVKLFVGPQGDKVAYGMNRAIAQYAKSGNNVIVDYITYDPKWLQDLQKQLQNITTYHVKVEISLEVLEQREAARGTSPVGHARSHYDTVYEGVQYDFVVNSEKFTSDELAQQLKDFTESKK